MKTKPETPTYPGDWRRIRLLPICPRHLAGIHCLVSMERRSYECICERYRRLFDHLKAWVTEEEELVLSAEPYEIDRKVLAVLRRECAGLGLAVSVTTSSPHSPEAFLLVIREA